MVRTFEDWYERLFDAAYRPSHRILRDRAAAEDVAAETLARMYVRWSRLSEHDRLEAWAVTCAINLTVDRLRAAKRDRASELDVLRVEERPDVEARLDLVRAVSKLPTRQREAVMLHFFNDLTELDVADVMLLLAGTVKVHIHRGVRTLRKRLASSALEDCFGTD
jgi:RNA polymerase sigma-70 factor (ECF subfamily)